MSSVDGRMRDEIGNRANKKNAGLKPGLRKRKRQSSRFGILRGAMKYSQISAMKYIAGIMVNSTV